MKSPLFWSKDDIWHCYKTKEETKQPPFYEIYCCSGFCQNSHHKGGNVGNILFMPWPAKKKNAICCFMQKQIPKCKVFFL